METWATVVIVLASNAIIAGVSLLATRKQIKHSEERFKMEFEAEKEADKRKRQREVRDEPLVKLRDELARMAEKLRTAIDLATQVTDEVTQDSDKTIKDLDRAVKEWDDYIKSGDFWRTLNMQYDDDIKGEAHDIFWDYQSTFKSIKKAWSLEKKNKDELISKVIGDVQRNDVRVSEVQLKIIKLREGCGMGSNEVSNKEGGRISMEGKEKEEPTLNEIMKEIKKSRDEATKSSEGSRISIWLTTAAFGGSIALVGLSYFMRFLSSSWDIMSSAIFISAVGFGFMAWSRHMARRRQNEFRRKWNEQPPRF